MLNRYIKFLIEHKLVAVILLLLFAIWGVTNAPFDWNTGLLPHNPVAVDAIPDIGENQQIVFTKWAGQSPQDIEDQITYPLTSSLLGLSGVKTIRSSSMFGFSSIYIIFEEDVDFYWSRNRILEKLNALPKNLLPSGVNPTLGPDATALGQIFWYTLEGRDKAGNVTGGWDLHELRSIQDYYIKYSLASVSGVSEVASIGGYVQEYQIDINPELMRQYGISLQQVVNAVKESNRATGLQTLEINQVNYFVRGLGYLTSISDIENTVVASEDFTAITIKDIAKVSLGPVARQGILDKEGSEVVGGVVVARYGSNPLEVINNIKQKIEEISIGLPSKTLNDGSTSKLAIVPFYDRTTLIEETLETLNDALTLETLIAILVVILMMFNLRASVLISGLLPVAVLMTFIAMKLFNVDANIVALSGIAIAIGTVVDVGIILSENIIRHLNDKKENLGNNNSINNVVFKATSEVSGAIITAIMTTIISFLPVFTMIGAEGKLFRPLAFTKTFVLLSAIMVTLFIIPPFAALVFRKTRIPRIWHHFINTILIITGIIVGIYGQPLGWLLSVFSILSLLEINYPQSKIRLPFFTIGFLGLRILVLSLTIIFLLAEHWRPLGIDVSLFFNILFVSIVCFGILGVFAVFKRYYIQMLQWVLEHKLLFLAIPITISILGILILKHTEKEFMPSLNEGSFLLMPSALPHSGIEENKRVLQQLDRAVANIPEIETVVGKAGRIESALDPAPISMYENLIAYKPEYMLNAQKKRGRYKTNLEGLFATKDGRFIRNPNHSEGNKNDMMPDITVKDLIEDDNGQFYRNWRPFIQSADDIWDEIIKVTRLPGITSSPKLQPIETRLVMLQTGMRTPMGIKIKGYDLEQIEAFGLELEKHLQEIEGIKKESIFADRIVGKPYLLIDIDRKKLIQYGISIEAVQNTIQIAVGGATLTQTVEGRQRYGVRVRYPRELRDNPTALENIYVTVKNGVEVPLRELATIRYKQGPQSIKSENTFLVGYVLFDKLEGFTDLNVIENIQQSLKEKISRNELIIPQGISYQLTGTYKNQLRAEKTLAIVVPLALIIIFLILYFQFRSVSTSLIIFSSVLVAFSGGFIMLWLYGQDWFMNFSLFGENLRELFQMQPINLSVAVWVGFIALFGISTDDGVVMTTYIKHVFSKKNPKDEASIRASVLEAASKRIRPCLITTATTTLALLPILTSTGRGSDIMIPMAIPIFGGMVIDITSYFIVPVLYSLKEEFRLKKISK